MRALKMLAPWVILAVLLYMFTDYVLGILVIGFVLFVLYAIISNAFKGKGKQDTGKKAATAATAAGATDLLLINSYDYMADVDDDQDDDNDGYDSDDSSDSSSDDGGGDWGGGSDD